MDTQVPVRSPQRTYLGHAAHVTAVFVQGSRLFTASHDSTVREYDSATGTWTKTYTTKGPVTAVFVNSSPPRLYSAAENGTISEWDTVTGDLVRDIKGQSEVRVNALFVTQGRLFVGAGTPDAGQTETQLQIYSPPAPQASTSSSIVRLAYSAAGTAAHLVGWSGTAATKFVEAYDLTSPSPALVQTYSGHSRAVLTLFATAGKLFTGSEDTTIREYDIAKRNGVPQAGPVVPTRVYQGHAQKITGIFVQGARLFSASEDRSVREWDLSTGIPLRAYTADCGLTSLWVDGARLFAGGCDQKVREWSATSGELVAAYCCADGAGGAPISSLFVAGNRLFTGTGFDPFGSGTQTCEYNLSAGPAVCKAQTRTARSSSGAGHTQPSLNDTEGQTLSDLRHSLSMMEMENASLREEKARLQDCEAADLIAENARLSDMVRSLRRQLAEAWQECDAARTTIRRPRGILPLRHRENNVPTTDDEEETISGALVVR
ncbi:WD40-repeat-containing domain protein [Powellomyces hirtus]|nr:WD40-repeat-containing domain protein [Powellomyces hirtus]